MKAKLYAVIFWGLVILGFLVIALNLQAQNVGVKQLTSTNHSVTFSPSSGTGSMVDLGVSSNAIATNLPSYVITNNNKSFFIQANGMNIDGNVLLAGSSLNYNGYFIDSWNSLGFNMLDNVSGNQFETVKPLSSQDQITFSANMIVTNGTFQASTNLVFLNNFGPVGNGSGLTNLNAQRVFNATNYGAVADGVTDNTAAIQAAINDATITNQGGVVYLPRSLAGNMYVVKGQLVDPVIALGGGFSEYPLTLMGDGCDWNNTLNRSGIDFEPTNTSASTTNYDFLACGIGNFQMHDLTIQANLASANVGAAVFFFIGQHHIHNCYFTQPNYQTAWFWVASTNATVYTFTGTTNDAYNGFQSSIDHNTFNYGSALGIFGSYVSNEILEEDYQTVDYTSTSYAIIFRCPPGTTTGADNGNAIINCGIGSDALYAIVLSNAPGTTISGNEFYDRAVASTTLSSGFSQFSTVTSLAVTSATGIVVGQTVSGAGIPYESIINVTSVAGTTIGVTSFTATLASSGSYEFNPTDVYLDVNSFNSSVFANINESKNTWNYVAGPGITTSYVQNEGQETVSSIGSPLVVPQFPNGLTLEMPADSTSGQGPFLSWYIPGTGTFTEYAYQGNLYLEPAASSARWQDDCLTTFSQGVTLQTGITNNSVVGYVGNGVGLTNVVEANRGTYHLAAAAYTAWTNTNQFDVISDFTNGVSNIVFSNASPVKLWGTNNMASFFSLRMQPGSIFTNSSANAVIHQ